MRSGDWIGDDDNIDNDDDRDMIVTHIEIQTPLIF